jgi:3-deoxy-D-manno-octulosonic-acid transferase
MNKTITNGIIGAYSLLFEGVRRGVLPFLGAVGRRKGWNLSERQALPRIVRGHRSRAVVWVHAASLGEARLLEQFLAMLEARNPDDCHVLTATTRAGVSYLEGLKNDSVIAVGFLPLDTLPLMRSLLSTFGISRVWLLETELWPAMLHACFSAGIPVGIANARMEERSFAGYRRVSGVVRSFLRRLDVVLVQNDTYARRFMLLGVRPESIHIVGNIKGFIRISRSSDAEKSILRTRLKVSPRAIVITAGCIHTGEGAVLRSFLDELTRRGHACTCIVVPRHLDEAEAIARELGPTVRRLPDIESSTSFTLCLIEKLGILDAMYRLADAAIVGGTFEEIGGHNVWEPARYGIPVFFGPHYFSQHAGCEKLLAAGVGFRVLDGTTLAAGVERVLWNTPGTFSAAAALFAEQMNQQQRFLEPLIP